MIIVMQPGASQAQIDHIVERVHGMELKTQVIQGTHRTVIAAVGEKRQGARELLEIAPGVEQVVPILAPYKMASTEVKPEPTVVQANGFRIGGKRVAVVAGPCSVESEAQIMGLAERVKAAGATALRGGAYKPRTSPYSFQGMKEEGLKLLAKAREATGLSVVTEVMARDQVSVVAEYADVLQIGARNMQNFLLLERVGQVGKPVLLKRGPSATLEELLLAAEYVLSEGNDQVILCERGIRTFESHTRFTLPLATVPWLKDRSHLPVLVDPSHATGHPELVGPMSKAAIAAGADGLMIEVHHDPENALSDGHQSLVPDAFADLMAQCRRVAEAIGRSL